VVGRARTPRLVFERIELTLTCHGDAKRPQAVKNLHVTGVLRDYLRKPSVSHRTFIQITTDQRYATLLHADMTAIDATVVSVV
jgi:hypothetical protein